MKFYKKLFNEDNKILKEVKMIAEDVDALKHYYHKMTDAELKNQTNVFKADLASGKTLEDILVSAYAVVREAAHRVINEFPFFVQIMGAVILHYGDIAEMKTGEGKTLTSMMPIYLNALAGKGVHVITVNEYLAERDSKQYGQILEWLGLSIGLNKQGLSQETKRLQYGCDVTYTINSELGFDYLRDNMVKTFEEKVQRGLNYALIDECDSILIDEARTPLIISGGVKISRNMYIDADKFVKTLTTKDYWLDSETKAVNLTKKGQLKAEKFFKLVYLYDVENSELLHFLQNALRANYAFTCGVEYLVQNGEIALIDQFTGRIMVGRSYSEGLQQAIQAKEKVEIKPENHIMAVITYQNYFRLYNKIAGMTGTAKTEEDELRSIYNTRVILVPTNKPIIRKDHYDLVYASRNAKYNALIKRIVKNHEKGQPILVGTISVEVSELISNMLNDKKIPHVTLNAKNHGKEAEIVALAGQKGAITIATNMAGRGTDIKITKEVAELGGLLVLGTERHESRRVDNQLRGRSGRQGDIGSSRFYLSVEDDLIIRFGGDKLRPLFSSLGEDPIHSKLLTNSIENAQRRIEGLNFDTRKNILEYDNVLSQQREVIYEQRDSTLLKENLLEKIERMLKLIIKKYTLESITATVDGDIIDYESVIQKFIKLDEDFVLDPNYTKNANVSQLNQYIFDQVFNKYLERRVKMPEEFRDYFEQNVILVALDNYWTKHIDDMTRLRHGIYLRGYAQKNPLQQYIEESTFLFERMRFQIAFDVCKTFLAFKRLPNSVNEIKTPMEVQNQNTKIGG